jgi:hypothetical protein
MIGERGQGHGRGQGRERSLGAFERTVCALTLAVVVCFGAGCELGVGYSGGYGGDYYGYPPDAYIATTEPIYFEGRANYWYDGRWYYRGAGGSWAYYDREPSALYQRRLQGPPVRHNFERSAGRGPARAPARSGGWRGHR